MGKDIKIYGKLTAKTAEGVIVGADQVKDDGIGKMQSEINAELYGKAERLRDYCEGLDSDVSSLTDNVDSLRQDLDSFSPLGNDFNVYNERTKNNELREVEGGTTAFDTLGSAIAYAQAKGVITPGIHLTFALASGSWKSYIYVGGDNADVTDQDNWQDLAGLSAGAEAIVNINELCNTPGRSYTLATALTAMLAVEDSTGITYRKPGLIVTFQKEEYQMETRQFLGSDIDFITPEKAEDASLWGYIGGNDEKPVQTSDEPEQGGKDAFSTGGAFEHLITDFVDDIDDDGNRVYTPVNAAGEPVGHTPIVIPASTGGSGGSSPTGLFNIYAEQSPVYGSLGNEISTQLAIRSVTYDGDSQIANSIVHIRVEDTTTGEVLVDRDLVNVPSASGREDYNYTLDLTQTFASAGSRKVKVEATDSQGGHKSITLTFYAVDLSISTGQNLSSPLTLRDAEQTCANVIRFAGAGATSIKGVGEIKIGDEWQNLPLMNGGLISDPYSHGVTVNPVAFGLSHGSYLVRFHGELPSKSSVRGNYLYTTLMVAETGNEQPLVAIRYIGNETVKLYSTLDFDVAAYTGSAKSVEVDIDFDGNSIASYTVARNTTLRAMQQVSGYAADGTKWIGVSASTVHEGETVTSPQIRVNVLGSVIEASPNTNIDWSLDFGSRSNSEADHTIESEGMRLDVDNANWESNGFGEYLNGKCLAVKDRMTAETSDAPLGSDTIEDNGFAIQMEFATDNVVDGNSMLLDCTGTQGAGFYIKGNAVGITVKTNAGTQFEERRFSCGERVTIAVVGESTSMYVEKDNTRYSALRLYINGDLSATILYKQGELRNQARLRMNSDSGELYVYYMTHFASFIAWQQAFDNYLVKMSDVAAMQRQFDFENVISNQEAENVSEHRPQWRALLERGMDVFISVGNADNFATIDRTKDTSTNISVNGRYYNAKRPWRSCILVDARKRPQGTTSTGRPKKNKRFDKWSSVVPMYPLYLEEHRAEMTEEEIFDLEETYRLFALGYIRVGQKTMPTKIITGKVDFSDSTNANDCGVCDMVNTVYRTLGSADPEYLTPAQRAYDGTWVGGEGENRVEVEGIELNHSTANHPIAFFRCVSENLNEAYFEAKGNWKEDKSDQMALGFCKTSGYNLGCKNYQDEDFVEVFAPAGMTLETYVGTDEFRGAQEQWDESNLYLLSPYCGRNYKFYRHNGEGWHVSTGSMTQDSLGKWVIEGDVLNPVEGFEMLFYQGMCWWQGVSSVGDMMAQIDTDNSSSWVQKLRAKNKIGTKVPAWTRYFEPMVDNDQLAIDYAMGRKVPFNLYVALRFCDRACKGVYPDDYAVVFYNHFKNFFNPKSAAVWAADCDYNAEFDSVSKNNQPMMFLEDGHKVVDGVYDPEIAGATDLDGFNYDFVLDHEQPIVVYHNKKYDIDGANGADNDGGCKADPESDTFEVSGSNPFQGYDSVVFQNLPKCGKMLLRSGKEMDYYGVVSTMRSLSVTTPEGTTLHPFSPEGAKHFFCTMRTHRWQKRVSAADGIRKYVKYFGSAYEDYTYAMQGLRLTDVPRFIDQRWRYRDAFYGCGSFFDYSVNTRIGLPGDEASIKIKAGKSGYFAIGFDQPTNVYRTVYLEAGGEHEFDITSASGSLMYIHQADRIAELDLSEVTFSGLDFSRMKMLRKLKVGSDSYQEADLGGSFTAATNLELGSLPFLEEVDVTKTQIEGIDASMCPRLKKVYASGSALKSLSLAKTSPVDTLVLPASMGSLLLDRLPNLTYPGGLEVAGLRKVSSLRVTNCPGVDAGKLLADVVNATTRLNSIRIDNGFVRESSSLLTKLAGWGTKGLNADGNVDGDTEHCNGMIGEYVCTDYVDESTLADLRAYFPNLEIHNAEYTTIVFDEKYEGMDVSDPANITNLDNGTGFRTRTNYEPSGHITEILSRRHGVLGKMQHDGSMLVCRLDDRNFNKFHDGSDASLVGGFGGAADHGDVFIYEPHYWYKGLNDHINNCKYAALSSNEEEPEDYGSVTEEFTLSALTMTQNTMLAQRSVGTNWEGMKTNCIGMNVYELPLTFTSHQDAKATWVRWPSSGSGKYAAFVDADGNILKIMSAEGSIDFVEGNYLLSAVPADAVKLVFTAPSYINTEMFADYAVITSCKGIMALESRWVEHRACVASRYRCAMIDGRLRSVSGANSTNGSGKQLLANTYTNIKNKCEGRSFDVYDYEEVKDFALLFFAKYGTRQCQPIVGYGGVVQATGRTDDLGLTSTSSADNNYSAFSADGRVEYVTVNVEGYEGIWGSGGNAELIDGYYSNSREPIGNTHTRYCLRPDKTGYKNAFLSLVNSSSYKFVRTVVHGRYCDIVASLTEGGANSATYYCCNTICGSSSGNGIYRATRPLYQNHSSVVTAGLNSHETYSFNCRMLFRGTISEAESVDAFKEADIYN